MAELVGVSTATSSAPPVQAPTVVEAFQRVVAQRPDAVALRTISDGVVLTWRQLGDQVERIARGLAANGIGRSDTVALLLPNTIECHAIDYAAMHLGAIPFAIFNSSSPEQIAAQLEKSDAKLIVTDTSSLGRVRAAVQAAPAVRVVTVDPCDDPDVLTLSAVIRSGDAVDFDFDAVWRAVRPDDLVTIIFTSGTTGSPKAAQWSHRTVMDAQRAMDAGIPVTRTAVVSFLPLAHAGGRLTSHYMALSYGSAITACPSMADAGAHIADARPDALLSVPRVFEKLQVAIEGAIETLDDPARATARRVLDIGRRLARETDEAIADHLHAAERERLEHEHRAALPVMAPVLARFGLDRLRSAIVGGAPAAAELIYFFRAIGVPLMEAYGSSEAALAIFNRVDQYKSGTAGIPLPGVEVRTAADGELLIRSSFNFVDYRGQPEETAAALDADGWLHTGDLAEIDDEGFVKIVDRKKELIISSSGKNMSAANIESAIRGEDSLIGQVVAIGDGRKFVSALITLDPEAAARAARAHQIASDDLDALAAHSEIRRAIDDAVWRGNARLSGPEQVKKYVLLPMSWSFDGDELTPTGKLKRRAIATKYAAHIEKLYED
ncbi:AMP-dependent synthetase/ligase [Mycobacterium sherrisii]|uniref:AMP-dependent synthetase/ligase n=1 Tax=Mycobacterium sherrisii TaxID=243061 RepID=UPI000A162CEE|nr:AMP-binding protein [Mycobacterium sherrisii]MCV7032520.1 AMP-binding protein [Mycobacterium sherrisii]ORW74180.1 AMP-dependent synthetase [Mycobacterium sherrisii]